VQVAGGDDAEAAIINGMVEHTGDSAARE